MSRALLLGSVFSSLAFLTRQLGLFLPLCAAVSYFITSKANSIPKRVLLTLTITALPVLTVVLYVLIFESGTFNQYTYSQRTAETVYTLLFTRSIQAGYEAWSQVVYRALEFLWQALGLFSPFAITLFASNYKRYLNLRMLKPLTVSAVAFASI